MQTAIHSKMIEHSHYDYICEAGLNWFWPIKARPGEVLLINCVSIYNNSGADYDACYKGIKVNNHIHRINYIATLNNSVVKRWAGDNYLTNDQELGIGITPDAAGETVQISFQVIRFLDSEYNKLFGL